MRCQRGAERMGLYSCVVMPVQQSLRIRLHDQLHLT